MHTTDKRIIKTKSRIKSAFMRLMRDNEIGKINVSDLTALAQVNRSTFYLHYKDVNAVKDDIEKDISKKISAFIYDFDIANIYKSTYAMFSNITRTLEQDEELKQYIIYSTIATNIAEKLKNILIETAADAIMMTFPKIKKSDIVYALTFAAGGIIDCFIKWERSKEHIKTLEETISQVSIFTENIISRITKL